MALRKTSDTSTRINDVQSRESEAKTTFIDIFLSYGFGNSVIFASRTVSLKI